MLSNEPNPEECDATKPIVVQEPGYKDITKKLAILPEDKIETDLVLIKQG